jgi:hypothetical protein
MALDLTVGGRHLYFTKEIEWFAHIHYKSDLMRLMPIILATLEEEIRRIKVQGQFRQKGHETTSQPIKKAGHDGVCLSSHLHRKHK